MDLRVLVYREDADYLAHCLEMDLVAQGDSPEAALRELAALITLQAEEALRQGDLSLAIRPAPAEYWQMFAQAEELSAPADEPEPSGFFERMCARGYSLSA